MLPQKFTFKKAERLKSRKLIGELFSSGQSTFIFPYRLVWLETELKAPVPVQFGVSVSSRQYPKAVDRNRIKRQIRECYRLQKHLLYKGLVAQNKQLALMVIFTARKPVSYEEMYRKMRKIIQHLIDTYEQEA